MLKELIVILLIASNASAATCDIPTLIKQNDPSPCNGYVISKETEEQIRVDITKYKKTIANLEETEKHYETTLKFDRETMKIYEDKLRNEQNFTSWEKVLYFGMGALITGAIAYGTVKTLR